MPEVPASGGRGAYLKRAERIRWLWRNQRRHPLRAA